MEKCVLSHSCTAKTLDPTGAKAMWELGAGNQGLSVLWQGHREIRRLEIRSKQCCQMGSGIQTRILAGHPAGPGGGELVPEYLI